MYEVKMRYMHDTSNDKPFNFKCERFNVEDNKYKFENVFMDNFIINDIEISNEDIASIKIN